MFLVGSACRQQMADAGVSGVVTADVLEDFSNDVVLTTQWIDGERTAQLQAATWQAVDADLAQLICIAAG
jgi:predicted unusual protein kinase regulating ubiquinone biosynthesis (AarF/ABC1/UbiB family)